MNLRARFSASAPVEGWLLIDLRPGSPRTYLEATDGTRTPWPDELTPDLGTNGAFSDPMVLERRR
jgi:hypothetical protein